MGERGHNILVGFTALAGIIGFAALLLIFGYTPHWMEEGYRITVNLPNAGGLNEGSRVWLNGIDIGRIESVTLHAPPKRGVRVIARIREEFQLPRLAPATVEAPLLGGSPTLVFTTETLEDDQLTDFVATDGTAELSGSVPTLLSEFARQMQQSIGGSMEKFEVLADDFTALSREWVMVGKNLNELFEKRPAEQVDAGDAAANISTIVQRVDQRLKELQLALDGVNTWVNDEELRTNIRMTAETAAKVSKKIDAGAEAVSEVAKLFGDNVDKLSRQYVAVADDLSAAIQSMRKTIDQAREGKGTFGKLINDAAVYDNLNDAVRRVNDAMGEFKLLIEKWKTEGLPIQL